MDVLDGSQRDTLGMACAGLAGCVFTTNLKTAHYVTRRMHTGMVWVNCWLHRYVECWRTTGQEVANLVKCKCAKVSQQHLIERYLDVQRFASAIWRRRCEWNRQGGRSSLYRILFRAEEHLLQVLKPLACGVW
jgi:hypothetical protein